MHCDDGLILTPLLPLYFTHMTSHVISPHPHKHPFFLCISSSKSYAFEKKKSHNLLLLLSSPLILCATLHLLLILLSPSLSFPHHILLCVSIYAALLLISPFSITLTPPPTSSLAPQNTPSLFNFALTLLAALVVTTHTPSLLTPHPPPPSSHKTHTETQHENLMSTFP